MRHAMLSGHAVVGDWAEVEDLNVEGRFIGKRLDDGKFAVVGHKQTELEAEI
jgi:hypothetical protein